MHRFPESLQADIRVHLNRQVFDHFKIFRGASEGSRRALATAFRVEIFPQHHFLLKEGDQVTKLYFIVSGSVDVIRSQQSMKFLGKDGWLQISILSRFNGQCQFLSLGLRKSLR